jgi:hypothetical protein
MDQGREKHPSLHQTEVNRICKEGKLKWKFTSQRMSSLKEGDREEQQLLSLMMRNLQRVISISKEILYDEQGFEIKNNY